MSRPRGVLPGGVMATIGVGMLGYAFMGRRGTSSAGSTRSCTSSGDVAPHGATLRDGYRAAEVCDAVLRSAGRGARETVAHRD